MMLSREDFVSVDIKRSYIMSKIRKTNTKPEILVRKYLYNRGFRYRLYRKDLPGNPDIILTKYKTIIFVNGCFWHAHEGCKYNKMPKSRTEYWIPKIENNAQRDIINKEKLILLGWRVFIIWECALKKQNMEESLSKLVLKITNQFE